jgi:hypothetical protein
VIGARQLPPELTSLVHHVELNKAGWWDKAVQQFILATVWLAEENLTAEGILERLREDFSVALDAERLRNQLGALLASETLVQLQGERFKISEQSLKAFAAGLQEAERIQEQAHQRFIAIMAECCPSVDAESTWQSFNEQFLVPLVHDMGARSYELISGRTIDLAAIPRFQQFLEGYGASLRPGLLTAVVTFIDPKEPNIRSHILRQLCAYFLLEASNLSEGTVRALSTMLDTTPSFTVFVDTNFLFCILGLDEDARNEAAQSLMHLVGRLANEVRVKLYVSPITIDEGRWVLQSCQHDLGGVRFTANLTDAALTTQLTGLTRKFLQECSKARQPLTAEDYFGPYIKDLVQIARGKGVELSGGKVDRYRTNPEVLEDLNNQLEFEKRRFLDRAKKYELLEHDMMLWHFVRDQRPPRVDSPADAGSWIATVDFRYLQFDRYKRRNELNAIPICVHPANLIQMLQFWVPRTQEFEEAVLGNLRLPFLLQEFDPSAEQLTIRILSTLARFENIDDLPQEAVASTLMNSALRQRLEAEPDQEKGTELVREALTIEEDQRVREQLNAQQAKTALLEREAREKDETIAQLQRQEKGRNEAVKEWQRQLKEERASRSSLEERLKTVEAGLRQKEQRQQISWFAAKWLVAPLAAIVALAFAISVPLATFSPWGSLRSALTALGACSLSLIVWLWLTDLQGSKDPIVSSWRPFAHLHAFKNWLFTALGLIAIGVLANALWDRISEIP